MLLATWQSWSRFCSNPWIRSFITIRFFWSCFLSVPCFSPVPYIVVLCNPISGSLNIHWFRSFFSDGAMTWPIGCSVKVLLVSLSPKSLTYKRLQFCPVQAVWKTISLVCIVMSHHQLTGTGEGVFFLGCTFDLVSGRQCICACTVPHPLCT